MHRHKQPSLAVDGLLTDGTHILLIRRRNPPYKSYWALPGGFVEYGETVENAVIREIREEAGLRIFAPMLIGVFSDPARDPRGHVVSCAFLCNHTLENYTPGSDASDVRVFELEDLPDKIAFDHDKIIKEGKRLIKNSRYFTTVK